MNWTIGESKRRPTEVQLGEIAVLFFVSCLNRVITNFSLYGGKYFAAPILYGPTYIRYCPEVRAVL